MRPVVFAGLAACLVLGGCVIVADEAGDSIVIHRGNESASASQAEAVRAARFDGQGLSLVVESNGCTDESSFEVRITDADPALLTLVRLAPDHCRAIVPQGQEVRWSYQELGLKPGDAVRLENPLRLPAAS